MRETDYSQSVILGDRVDIEPLLRDGALVRFGAAHVESHTVREDPNLLESECFVTPGTFGLIPDDEICTLELSLFDLGIERLKPREIGCDHSVLFLGHL